MPAVRRVLSLLALLCLATPSPADAPVNYVRDVKPILARHCASCHSAKVHRGGLRTETAAFLLTGGDSGTAIVPGKAAASLLIKSVKGERDVTQMPYKKPALSPAEIRVLTAWVDQGAKAPAGEKANGADHWAFQAPIHPSLPRVSDAKWPRNPIDYFVLARLEKEGIQPSPETTRATLIRRVSLDLIGLPP